MLHLSLPFRSGAGAARDSIELQAPAVLALQPHGIHMVADYLHRPFRNAAQHQWNSNTSRIVQGGRSPCGNEGRTDAP